MSASMIDVTNINTDIFSYTSAKPFGQAKVINLLNKEFKESLTLALPEMMTWGAQEVIEEKNGIKIPTGKYTMSLQFPTSDYSTPAVEATMESFKTIFEKVKIDAQTHSKDWFGKECSKDVIDDKFNDMLKYPKIKNDLSGARDYTKMPTLTVKIPRWGKEGEQLKWQSEIFSENGDPLFLKGYEEQCKSPIEFLNKMDKVITCIQCGGIWIVNGKISITWNLQQAIVRSRTEPVSGVCLLPTIGKRTQSVMEEGAGDSVSATLVPDSDEEDANENVDEDEDADVVEEECENSTPPPEDVIEHNETDSTNSVVDEEPVAKKKRVNKKK